MTDARPGRLCVYCGSRMGEDPAFREKAEQFGHAIAAAGLSLVYGGGGSGLMGVIARAARQGGSHVTGIIPDALLALEQGLRDIDDFRVVRDYHERKTLMLEMSDAFAVFPGGPGTLEEFAEQLALAEQAHHMKPIYVVNIGGYWNSLLTMIGRMREEGFADTFEGQITTVKEPGEVITLFLKRRRPACPHEGGEEIS